MILIVLVPIIFIAGQSDLHGENFLRNATEVEEGWVRILNFYVNAFGEWQIGSEETVKGGKFKRIPK